MTRTCTLLAALCLLAGGLYATGQTDGSGAGSDAAAGAAMGGKYQEAPVLAALVAAGELPPVEERLPAEPAVRAPLDADRHLRRHHQRAQHHQSAVGRHG